MTFKNSTTTFLQLKSVNKHSSSSGGRAKAYDQLKALAGKFHNRQMAMIAVEVKTAGHFDKVIAMIDQMVALLRKEEMEDIEHRDRCENSQNANANEMDDLDHEIEKTEASLGRMEKSKKELQDEIEALKKEIAA